MGPENLLFDSKFTFLYFSNFEYYSTYQLLALVLKLPRCSGTRSSVCVLKLLCHNHVDGNVKVVMVTLVTELFRTVFVLKRSLSFLYFHVKFNIPNVCNFFWFKLQHLFRISFLLCVLCFCFSYLSSTKRFSLDKNRIASIHRQEQYGRQQDIGTVKVSRVLPKILHVQILETMVTVYYLITPSAGTVTTLRSPRL